LDDVSSESLDGLSVPAFVLARAGVGAAEYGDLEQAMRLLSRAAETQRSDSLVELDGSLERVLTLAIESGDTATAQAGLELLCGIGVRDSFVCRAIRVRVADMSVETAAERQANDHAVRQIQHDLARLDAPLREAEVGRLCDHLEAIYWRRYRLAETAASRVDSLDGVAEACDRAGARSRTLLALQSDAAAALAEGRETDAIVYLEILVDNARRGVAVPEQVVAEARETIHRLLWPTYLENRRSRFSRRFAEPWAEAGIFDPEREQVSVVFELPVPDSCLVQDVASCSLLLSRAEEQATEQLVRLAIDGTERAGGSIDPRPYLAPIELSLVTLEGLSAYFRATVSLETLFRSVYEAEAPQMTDAVQ